MTVRAELRHWYNGLGQAPLDGQRCEIALNRRAYVKEERGAETTHQMRRHNVCGAFGLADPLAKMVELNLAAHVDAFWREASLGRGPISSSASSWPIAGTAA